MNITQEKLTEILEQHKQWLQDNAKGKRAALSVADLSGAALSVANLSGANLSGARIIYTGFPLWCGSFDAKADDKLILQFFAHICRFNIEGCSKKVKDLVETLPKLAKNGFCTYEDGVKEI